MTEEEKKLLPEINKSKFGLMYKDIQPLLEQAFKAGVDYQNEKSAAHDMLNVLLELQESASYWSEYDVPIGIVDRINAAINKAKATINVIRLGVSATLYEL